MERKGSIIWAWVLLLNFILQSSIYPSLFLSFFPSPVECIPSYWEEEARICQPVSPGWGGDLRLRGSSAAIKGYFQGRLNTNTCNKHNVISLGQYWMPNPQVREREWEREGWTDPVGSNPTASPLLSGKAFDLGHNFQSMFCLVAIWVLSQIDQTVCSGLEAKKNILF